jgi:hypothetical protein
VGKRAGISCREGIGIAISISSQAARSIDAGSPIGPRREEPTFAISGEEALRDRDWLLRVRRGRDSSLVVKKASRIAICVDPAMIIAAGLAKASN